MKWLRNLLKPIPGQGHGYQPKGEGDMEKSLKVATAQDIERVQRELGMPYNHNPGPEELAQFGLKLPPRPEAPAAPPRTRCHVEPDQVWPRFECRVPMPPVKPPRQEDEVQSLRALEEEIRFLKLDNTDLTQKLATAQAELRMAKGSQRSLSLRAAELQKDWPDVHKRYFTQAGAEDRAEGVPTKAKRKPKRK